MGASLGDLAAVDEDLGLIEQVGAGALDQVDQRQLVAPRDLVAAQALPEAHGRDRAALDAAVVDADQRAHARDQADAKEKQRLAYNYYQRFTNVFDTPGEVHNGAIKPIQYEQTQEQLAQNLLVGTAGEIVDKLQQYAELGIHEINLNMNIGAAPVETLTSIERFATKVMPHFTSTSEAAISRR